MIALLSCITTRVFAYDFSVENEDGVTIYYNYINNKQEAAVTRSTKGCYTDTVNIPATVTIDGTTLNVTSINENAFYFCNKLTSVTLPNTVTSIGENAFDRCLSLTSFIIPNSVTSIGRYAFATCESLTSINIPTSVTSIGNSAFAWCTNLTSVNIPNSVTSIGNYAFSCTNLTSVTIPNSVTSIGKYTFCDTKLTSITIPNSVTSIGDLAFYGTKLTSVTIPNSVTSIGSYAFANCERLTSVTIPNSVTYIGSYAFSESNLKVVTLLCSTLPTCGNEVFDEISSNTTLYCKASLEQECQEKDPWKNFNNIVAMTLFMTISDASIATGCFEEDLDFTDMDVKAYIASGFNPETGKVLLTNVKEVPAGTGFIVKGESGAYEVPIAATKYLYANMLVGTLADTVIVQKDGSYTNYVLSNGTDGIGFYLPTTESTISANKAYLHIPSSVISASSSEVKSVIGLCFEDEDESTTGFFSIKDLTEGISSMTPVYNINGQRKQGLTKGLNIINGKKILIK